MAMLFGTRDPAPLLFGAPRPASAPARDGAKRVLLSARRVLFCGLAFAAYLARPCTLSLALSLQGTAPQRSAGPLAHTCVRNLACCSLRVLCSLSVADSRAVAENNTKRAARKSWHLLDESIKSRVTADSLRARARKQHRQLDQPLPSTQSYARHRQGP